MPTSDNVDSEKMGLTPLAVQKIMDDSQQRTEWTARVVLRELKLTSNKPNRKLARRILRQLWIDGKIKRRATKMKNSLVAYSPNSSELSEYTVPCPTCQFPVFGSEGKLKECTRCASSA